MKLTRGSSYALTALAHMARQPAGKHIASHLTAAEGGIPERFLLKLFKPLVDARVLVSVRGPHGGYKLARPPKDVTLLEVVEAVDGPVRGEILGVSAGGATALDRRLQEVSDGAAVLVREWLSEVTLADLAKGK